jgi:hypothetical protein
MVYDNHINENKLSLSVYPSIDLPSCFGSSLFSQFSNFQTLSFYNILGTVLDLSLVHFPYGDHHIF